MKRLGWTLVFALTFTVLSVTAQAAVPVPASNDVVTYVPKEFTTDDGVTLHGHLALPTGKTGPFPAVLLLVGTGPGNRYENLPALATADGQPTLLFQGIEKALVQKGIAVFTFDKRGVIPKDNTFLENDVTPLFRETGTFNRLFGDALTAFDVTRSFPQVDPARVGVLGYSEGAIFAVKIAEERPQLHSIFALGIAARSYVDALYYQAVTAEDRTFHLMDSNFDGYVTEDEYQPFYQEDSKSLNPTLEPWEKIIPEYDQTHDGKISEQEWRYGNEKNFNEEIQAVLSGTATDPDSKILNPLWAIEFANEGPFLSREVQFCSKMSIFQGEEDRQATFEDALAIKDSCQERGTPLAGFQSYPGLSHGFSPYIELRNWKKTVGPMDPRAPQDIAVAASQQLAR